MSFRFLADRLAAVAQTLHRHTGPLDSKSLLAEADKFVKAFDKFQRLLDGVVAGQSPEAQELARQLRRAYADDDKALKVFAKKHAPPKGVTFAATDTPAQRVEKAAAAIATAGGAEGALAELRRREAPTVLDFSREDELSLLQQIRRLGQLDEEDRKLEGERLLREPEKIRLLAGAAKLKITAKSTPKALLKKLMETGQRYAENTGR